MQPPDQRLLEHDLLSAEFCSGAAKGLWGLPEQGMLPDGFAWPNVILWMAAAPRPNSPDKFYVYLDATGYRSVPPTGTFWDSATKQTLAHAKRPRGKPDSRFAKVFRTDWESGSAFYHPYDRKGSLTHPEWPKAQPHLIWDSSHTIVDYLEEFQSLLMSGDYIGV
jgi:hypothetical protein